MFKPSFKISLVLLAIFFLVGCEGSNDLPSGKTEVITVKSQPVSTILAYAGTVQPYQYTIVTSPVDGVIEEASFHYGDLVKQNQTLFTLSSEKFLADYKNALLQYLKNKNEFEVSSNQLKESEFLHKNQLISDDDYKSKQNSYYNAQLTLIQTKDALFQMIKQLDTKNVNVDDLSIENVGKINQILHAQIDGHQIKIFAPITGVVLLPPKGDGENEIKKISKGDLIKQGDVLGIISDSNGLTIHVNVNEFNINQLQVGQSVIVSGAAFPEYTLHGKIIGIVRQGQTSQGGVPTFPIEIAVEQLTPAQQKVIHPGMSAKVEINLSGPSQISIPLAAIFEKNGQPYVRKQDPRTKKIHEVLVKTGQTTADSVVIEGNLKEGDNIVYTR